MYYSHNRILRMGPQKDTVPIPAAGERQSLFGRILECLSGRGATTAPNSSIINVHGRMPVLLTDDEAASWLHDTGMASAKLTALQPDLELAAV